MQSQLLSTLFCFSLAVNAVAGYHPFEGYAYGEAMAPSGTEWQSPMQLGYNKLPAHANFFSFGSTEQARKILPENSTF